MRLNQLVVKVPGQKEGEDDKVRTLPIEDIGVIVLDNKQITVTQALMETLLDNNCALITCDNRHMPVGLLLPLYGNTVQNERFRQQIDSSLPLKKQLWQQTIQSKIMNQSAVLDWQTGEHHENMVVWAKAVRSGDPDNLEGRAAAYYWKTLFPEHLDFTRGQYEDEPNNLLNYGYAILRAIIARAIVSSGLLPTLGIHHHNRYNAYCLADDIMEPYRPYVDKLVCEIVDEYDSLELTQEIKVKLLNIPVIEVVINGRRSPLMVAASTTTASLVKCFAGETRKILYPEM